MHQVVDRTAPNTAWPAFPIAWIKSITIAVAATCMVLTLWTRPMSFKEFPMEALIGLFAKLIAIALFIERTVEVLLTPWRGLGSNRMTARVKQAKAKLENGQTDSVEEMSNAEDELREYKGQTRQIAFLVALALGMMISVIGLRGLEFFVDPNSMRTSSEQTFVFHALDVLVTGALLAGKAEGLHKMVSVFTSQLDKSAERVKGAA
jgi:hypothetical protein